MFNKLFRRKKFEDKQDSNFSKELSTTNLTFVGIGAIIGAGIFSITGIIASNSTGPALTIACLLAGLSCIIAALCYAELSSLYPISGSAYSYAYFTIGEFFAWIVGWALIVEYFVSFVSIAVSWSGYMAIFLNSMSLGLPKSITSSPINISPTGQLLFSGTMINFLSIFIIIIISIIIVKGIKQSNTVNSIIVILKLTIISLFIGIGIFFINVNNYIPYIPENTGQFGHFGLSGIIRGAGMLFFAYLGFDAVSTLSQESKNPKKSVPRAIIYSLTIATIFYIALSFVLTGVANYTTLNVVNPISFAISQIHQFKWISPFLDIGAIAGLTSAILIFFLGLSRIIYSISNDGLLPKSLSSIHKKFKTPYKSIIIITLMGVIVAGLFPLDFLANLVSIGSLLVFTITSFSVILLRKKEPTLERPFQAPFVPILPIIGMLICIIQMISLSPITLCFFILWMIFGIVVYFIYSRKNSHLNDS
jgi:APA family basic amino acid/polyamine antiporter